MKKTISAFAVLALIACNNEENQEVNDGTSSIVALEVSDTDNANDETETTSEATKTGAITVIEYVEEKHNFGNVRYPSENLHTFRFKNTGNAPLVIESATASCGCTVPNKPEKPILPGEFGEMDVIFRPKEGQAGQVVTKTVTVTANTEPKQTYLHIEANVLAPMK